MISLVPSEEEEETPELALSPSTMRGHSKQGSKDCLNRTQKALVVKETIEKLCFIIKV